ncbi:MAG TPA: YbaB/EbfC family nucleoid-associated protein [Actinobacteria bacterium]|nr:YbaB/EbfC family nucleoid-associated protein [Actinomycetes bacterium]HEX21271.1 YbaB/EbfC family nucleoid-associated protein [Actinomycetota bacterium]
MGKQYGKMMKQMKKMQAEMARVQEDLAGEQVEASAGGGMVKATVNGQQQVLSITIDPEAVDPNDIDMLQDMVTAAVNEALRQSQELANKKMGGLTAGLGIPGL